MVIQDLMIAGEEEILIKDLYFILMKNQLGNVKKCKTLIRHGEIFVNGVVADDPYHKVKKGDKITYQNQCVDAQPFVYYMMNKPSGYICANKDKYWPCVIDLIDRDDCICIGRLDQDTTGLLLITNDKSLSKRLLLPQNHIDKRYLVRVDNVLHKNLVSRFNDGIIIDKNVLCESAVLDIVDDYHCSITIHEGKYHQVKKMFMSCGYKVLELKRVEFAGIELDLQLNEGEYRLLDDEEIRLLNEI